MFNFNPNKSTFSSFAQNNPMNNFNKSTLGNQLAINRQKNNKSDLYSKSFFQKFPNQINKLTNSGRESDFHEISIRDY